ncbi:MAG: hypothetical protein NW216_07500 [Hyphomicrobium sp.]|nr:hypothetical protein [Hyphomicrobium sp.]
MSAAPVKKPVNSTATMSGRSSSRAASAKATRPRMTADEFRAALARFGYAQEGFSRALGYSGRAGQRWASGEAAVPGAVAVVLRLLIARPEQALVLADIAPIPDAVRDRRGRKAKVAPSAATNG